MTGPRSTRNPGGRIGDAEFMEAQARQRWDRHVDRGRLGAHYDYIVMHVGAAHRQAPKENPEQRASDMAMAKALGFSSGAQSARGPRELPRPKSMCTAFTDRALRLRDGNSSKVVLKHEDSCNWIDDRSTTVSATPRARKNHADMGPAGITSANHNSMGKIHQLGDPSRAGLKDVASKSFCSERVSSALNTAASTLENLGHEELQGFHSSLGKKIRGAEQGKMLPHRGGDGSRVAGEITPQHAAGEEKILGKKRQAFQGSAGERTRSGVALVLVPQRGDPPPPTKITHFSKGQGACNGVVSRDASRHLQQNNQSVFRFAANDSGALFRSKSVPPDFRGCAGNSSVSRRGKTPVDRMQVSPRGTSHAAHRSHSNCMSTLMNSNALVEKDRSALSARKRAEPEFRAICQHTAKNQKEMARHTHTIKSSIGRGNSSGVANEMVWL